MKKLSLLLVMTVILSLLIFSCQKSPMGIQSLGNDDMSNIAKKPDHTGKPENPGKSGKKGGNCTSIKAGSLTYPFDHYLNGEVLELGYDDYGYNYHAHIFNGFFVNAYLGAAGYPPYTGDAGSYVQENPDVFLLWAWEFRDIKLVMKWNDAWLSKEDCDGDGTLDRHPGSPSYFDSGAQLTNHLSWEDELGSHESYKKIIAVPGNATPVDDMWILPDGTVIGKIIWDSFAIVKEENSGEGTSDIKPAAPRLGSWDGDEELPPIFI